MKRILLAAGCVALFCLVLGQDNALAQNLVPNGDFEMQARAEWLLTGNNTGAQATTFDTNGNGDNSWCWKRTPGTTKGNGGLEQDVYLFGGVLYNFTAHVAYDETG